MDKIKQNFIIITVLWVAIIGFSSWQNYSQIITSAKNNALTGARINLKEIITFRHWIAQFGGVYVPITKEFQPNPYLLHIKNRDIKTIQGKKLTLVNPAWMTRQVFEMENKQTTNTKHIISNEYMNPINKPDNWQKKVLTNFEKDNTTTTEYYEFTSKTLKYMMPLITKQSCIKCHPNYTGRIGDIRGAISFYIDLTPYNISKENSVFFLTLSTATILLIGLILLFIGYKKQTKSYKINEALSTENYNKEKEILEANKMAQMGDMIGNIAHQWRQPLSAISAASSGMLLEKEMELLTDENFIKYNNGIVRNTQYLSETIDTFRDFIKEKKTIKEIILQERISKTLTIVSASLKSNQIALIDTINYDNPIKLTMIVGELSQVLINIINNAKDALVQNKIDNGFIKLDLLKEKNNVIITIEDNAGGIPEEILPKIFDPYFTTKHQSQGTGLGLHMSLKIVMESLGGKLYVKNTKEGAKFTIELPLSSTK